MVSKKTKTIISFSLYLMFFLFCLFMKFYSMLPIFGFLILYYLYRLVKKKDSSYRNPIFAFWFEKRNEKKKQRQTRLRYWKERLTGYNNDNDNDNDNDDEGEEIWQE